MRPTVLFLFNSSDYAVRPWLDDGGFNVVSVDYSDTDHSGAHREPVKGHTVLNIDLAQNNAAFHVRTRLRMLGLSLPSLCVSFAPCTDLAVSGAKHFASKLEKDPCCQERAVRMAKLASEFGCPYMVENPVSVLATMWRKPDMYWHPWEFSYQFDKHSIPLAHPEFPDVIPPGDWYNKKSCLWVGGGFILPRKDTDTGPTSENPGWAKLGGKSARTKYIRSLTPRGFAQAVYESNRDNILSLLGSQVFESCGTIADTDERMEFTW